MGKTLIIACAALTKEIRSVVGRLGGEDCDFALEYLPSPLHNRPDRIPVEVEKLLKAKADEYDKVVIAYADCGTGGHLDSVCEKYGAVRLPGAHCYEFFAGSKLFEHLADEEPGTFYLTDYLARYFEALVWGGLGLDRHPELRDMYFGNYKRVVFLNQVADENLQEQAKRAAAMLNLKYEYLFCGLDMFEKELQTAIAKCRCDQPESLTRPPAA